MKKKIWLPLLIVAILLLCVLQYLTPKNFDEITAPYHKAILHSHNDCPECSAVLPASNDFGSDPAAFQELNESLSRYSYRRDLRSLLPFLYQPREHIDVCITYYTSCSSGGLMLWDEDTLWVSSGGKSYIAYHPDKSETLRQKIMDLVEKYGQ